MSGHHLEDIGTSLHLVEELLIQRTEHLQIIVLASLEPAVPGLNVLDERSSDREKTKLCSLGRVGGCDAFLQGVRQIRVKRSH